MYSFGGHCVIFLGRRFSVLTPPFQALSYGYKLVKVHKVISFYQSRWMADYINFCADTRRAAKMAGDFSMVELAKLWANSIFGKMIENLKRRRNMKVCTASGKDKAEAWVSSYLAKDWKVTRLVSEVTAMNDKQCASNILIVT